jgi:hypothetical protein
VGRKVIGRRFRDADFYCTTACRYLLHDNVQIRALVEALQSLWMNADLHAVEVREIAVQRTFVDFEDFWTTSMMAATVNQAIAAMASGHAELLKMRMLARLPADVAGRITHDARANAIRGRVPK